MAEKIDIISNQKGASIIAVVAIMLILAVMGAALISLVITGSDISINQLQSEQAFSIAEGGIEKALTEFVKNNTPCASLVYTNSLGAGSFTTSVTVPPASTTLSAPINAGDVVIPVNSLVGFAGHGRIRIENEDINYAGTSTSLAICGGFAACFTGAQRGVAGSTPAAHGIATVVSQDECLVRSTGTVTNSSAQRIVEKGIQMPGAMMVYAKADGDGTPYFRRWDGTNWGPERTATSIGAGRTINYLILKFARTRNEAILGTLDSTGEIRVQVWNGNTQTWSPVTTLLADVGGGGDTPYRSFDIEYETSGDRAIVVYKDANGSADPDYRIWDGTAWSGATNINIPTTGEVRWIELAPYPLLDSTPRNSEIVMITLDANDDVYGRRWDGAAWIQMEPGLPTTWDNSAATSTTKVIDVAYEQASGNAMFIWGSSTNDRQSWRIWNGALGAINNLDIGSMGGPGGGADLASWIRLVPDPTSNGLMYGVQDDELDLNTRFWNGAVWDTVVQHPEHDVSTEDVADRNFDIVFETNPAFAGQAWLVWGNGGTTSRKQWTGAAWGAETPIAGSDDAALVQLMAHPRTGVIFAGIYQATGSGSDDITALQNVGGVWSAETIIWNGGITSNLYERVFIATERYVPIINWREIYP